MNDAIKLMLARINEESTPEEMLQISQAVLNLKNAMAIN